MPRPPVRSLVSALGVCAGLGLYAWLNVVLPWPYLARTRGDFGYQYPAAEALLQGASPFGAPWYDYPPLAPVLLAPLALLPFQAARLTWFLLNHLCLLAAAALLLQPLQRLGGPTDRRTATVAVAAVWLLAGTLQENLVLGQWNPVLLLLLALALRLDSSHPDRAAATLGLAAGIKIWPGLLLAGALLQRRWRPLAAGLLATVAALLLPGLLIAALTPPPHLPVHGPFWMGTPAPLNLSLPAAVLRLTYRNEPPGPLGMPHDWAIGNNPEQLHLSPPRRALSIAVSLVTLLTGLALLAHRCRFFPLLTGRVPSPLPTAPPEGGRAEPGPRGGRRGADGSRPSAPQASAPPPTAPDEEPSRASTRSAGLPRRPERGPRPAGEGGHPPDFAPTFPLLAALVALALVAAPLAWYHYHLLQLPGLAYLVAQRLRYLVEGEAREKAPGKKTGRSLLPLLGLLALLALLTGLTRPHLWAPIAKQLGASELVALQVPGWTVPALGLVLFGLLTREIRRPAAEGAAPEAQR